jgi:hypothetical protein
MHAFHKACRREGVACEGVVFAGDVVASVMAGLAHTPSAEEPSGMVTTVARTVFQSMAATFSATCMQVSFRPSMCPVQRCTAGHQTSAMRSCCIYICTTVMAVTQRNA